MSWGCQLRHTARYPPSLETGQLWGKGLGQTWKNSFGNSPESIRLSRVTYTNPPPAAEAQTSPREVRTNEHSRHERCLKTLWDILSARVQSTWFLEQLHVSLVVFDILLIQRPSGDCKFASICWMLMCLPGLVRPLGPWAPTRHDHWAKSSSVGATKHFPVPSPTRVTHVTHITHLAKSDQEKCRVSMCVFFIVFLRINW